MADYLEAGFCRLSPDLHTRVAALRANSVCLMVCALFGFMSAVIPCIGNSFKFHFLIKIFERVNND